MTTWWAGPAASGLFAALGAEVVHVESTRHIDGARTAGGMFVARGAWWEYSPFFLTSNANKLGITWIWPDPRVAGWPWSWSRGRTWSSRTSPPG